MPLVIWCVGDCIDSVDCIWYYSNFKYWFFLPRNMEYSPSVYVIFDFFHQCLIIFFVQFFCLLQFSSVQFSRSDMSSSLRPHELQHNRPPCPSPTPGVQSDSCPSSQWCHSGNLIFGHPLLLLPPIHPSIRVFSNESILLMSWPKYWSFSFSIIPSKDIHPRVDLLQYGLVGSLCSPRTLKSLLQHHSSNASILRHSAFFTIVCFKVSLWCYIIYGLGQKYTDIHESS